MPTRPPRMVTVRGKVPATSGWWVTTRIVVPKSLPSPWISSSMWSRSSWLSWLVGSSASSSCGALVTLQASARRCRSPPDIDETTWSPCASRPTRRSSSASPSVRSGSLLAERLKRRFWRAVA